MSGPYRIRPAELLSAPRRLKASSLPVRLETARLRAAELQQRPPGCFLLTGYRGAGKTSFAYLLAALAEQESVPVLFVEVNGAVTGGEEERPRFLLRKMQRGLYLALRERGFLERLPRALRWELHMAYIQTSHTVQNSSKVSWQMAAGLERKGWTDRAFLTALGAALLETLPMLAGAGRRLQAAEGWLGQRIGDLLSLFRIPHELLASLGRWAYGIPYWVVAIAVPALLALFTPAMALKWSRSGEQEIATRYDDEVAESSFIHLLEQLAAVRLRPESRWRRAQKAWTAAPGARLKAAALAFLAPGAKAQRLRLVFVIDELDKLDAPGGEKTTATAEFDALVRGLKPVLLCGQAHFLLISGMEDFYRWYQGSATEDDRFVNLFSGQMHVPAMGADDLRELFASLLLEPGRADDPVLRQFCDALILRSRGRPRQFLNEFARHVIWLGEPSLALSDQEMERATLDAGLQRAMEQVWRAVSTWNLPPGIDDMLRTRALLWIQRMLRKEEPFEGSDIWQESDFAQRAEQDYRKQALDILEALLEAMAGGQLIQRRENDTRYEWQVNPRASSLERAMPAGGSTGAEPPPPPPPEESEPAVAALAGGGRENRRLGELLGVLRSWGWQVDQEMAYGRQPILSGIDPDGVAVWIALRTAGQLGAWIEELIALAARNPQLVSGGLRILLVIVGSSPLPAPLKLYAAGWGILPVEFTVAHAGDLEPDTLATALRNPLITFGVRCGTGSLVAETGDEFAVLRWTATPDKSFRLLRTTRPGDPKAGQGITPDQPGSFTDVNLTNGIPYFYTLMDAGDRPVAAVSVTPAADGAPKDGRYWQAVIRAAAGRILPEAEGRLPLPDRERMQKELASPEAVPQREEYLGMGLTAHAADGGVRLTSTGQKAAAELLSEGPKPTLWSAMIHHPAMLPLLKQLAEAGQITLPLKNRNAEDWLHYLARETGALRAEENAVTWSEFD